MNILISSVGRRSYIVNYFKDALGDSGKVYVCNSERTIAFQYADKAMISPLIYSDGYIDFLLDSCKKNDVSVIISLFDIDLFVLAKNKKIFEEYGIKVIVSEPELLDICNDKWKTYKFLGNNGFNVPKTYKTLDSALEAIDENELIYPVVVKPRFGCGSIGLNYAYDREELQYVYRRSSRRVGETYLRFESAVTEDKILIQEMLNGQEYGADIINDLYGNNRSVVLRKKIAMRAGETDIAELISNRCVEAELRRLGTLTKHIGNMDCDIFMVEDTPYILEMNARFGGGYPFSYIGGCNLPKAIIEWCKGKEIDDNLLQSETGFTAYKELFITKEKLIR